MSACRSCMAELRWARTAAGRAMPLDFAPDAVKGNVRLLDDGRCETLGPLEVEIARASNEPLYTSHFFTCPERDHWRGSSREDMERVA